MGVEPYIAESSPEFVRARGGNYIYVRYGRENVYTAYPAPHESS